MNNMYKNGLFSQMNINQNELSTFDESKFVLYKTNSLSKNNIRKVELPQDFPLQRCYIIQGNQFKTYINNFNNLFGNNRAASTFVTGASNSFPKILNIDMIVSLKDFYIVNKEFLKFTGRDKALLEQQNIYFYKKDNKIILFFPNEPNGKNILEILVLKKKDNNNFPVKNKNLDVKGIINQKEKIFKKFLLLFAFENDFFKLMEKPFDDGYNDIKEYYLINKNWINLYKQNYQSLINNISNYLNTINLNKKYLYNFFYFNFEELLKDKNVKAIIETINIIKNSNLEIDSNLYPYINNEFKQPFEFCLIPEKLFDLFYEEITNKEKTKKDFCFLTLLGDNVLFIQDKSNNNIFYTYIINDNNEYFGEKRKDLQMYCVLKYENKNSSFFEDVDEFIKGKGLLNYLFKRKINVEIVNTWQNLLNKQIPIGQCLIKEKCPKIFLETIKIKQEIQLIYRLFNNYKDLIKQIQNIQDLNKNINNINELAKYLSSSISLFIIDKNELNYFKDNLFLKDFENIFKGNQIYDDKVEQFLFNKLKNSLQQQQYLKNIISKLNLLKDNEIDNILKNQKEKNLFSFINLDLIKPFLNSQNDNSISNKLNISQFFLFKNKNEYFIANNNCKKIFKVIVLGQNEFKLEEFNFGGDNKNMIKILIELVKTEKKILEEMKSSLKYLSQNKYFYLINSDWIRAFKKHYNYKAIMDNYNYGVEVLNNNIKITQEFPDNLKQQNSLNFSSCTISNTNLSFPSKFLFIEKDIFDQILKELNSKFNIFLKISQYYKIFFGDKKFFIRDLAKKNLFYIYTLDTSNNIQIEYIIQTENGQDITNFSSSCDYNETFEQYLVSNFGINLRDAKPQVLLDENLNKKGDLIIVKPKNNINIKYAKHCLGLENIGATCYMNATIQCLCHVFNIKKYFLNRQLMYQSIPKGNDSLSLEFFKVINNLWKNSYHGKSYYTPRDFKNIISRKNPLFQGIAANDSKDLIIFLYETMHSELNKPTGQYNFGQNIMNNQTLASFRNNYYSGNNSIFSKTFYFEQESLLKCMTCGYAKISYTIYNIIIFPLEKVREYLANKYYGKGFESVKLEDCFENYQQDEILQGSNQIFCNNCRQMANAANGNKLYTLPEVMTIILNRGKGLEFDVNFEYPLHLNVDKYVLDPNCKNNDYELICVLSHIGPSGMSGHFIAFCRSPDDNRWYIYNDAQVTECMDPRYHNIDMIEGLPYVLFYQKSNVKNQNNQGFNSEDIIMDYNYENSNEDSNKLTLFFKLNDKEYYLDTNKDKRIHELINELNKKYGISKNLSLYLEGNNELIPLDYNKKIRDFPKIKNNSKIVMIYN